MTRKTVVLIITIVLCVFLIIGSFSQKAPLTNLVSVSFTTTHFSHYALVQTKSSPAIDNETEDDKPSTKSDKEDTTSKIDNDKESPKTGDNTCLILWGSILLISVITMVVLLKKRKANI